MEKLRQTTFQKGSEAIQTFIDKKEVKKDKPEKEVKNGKSKKDS